MNNEKIFQEVKPDIINLEDTNLGTSHICFASDVEISIKKALSLKEEEFKDLIDDKISTERIVCNMLMSAKSMQDQFSKKIRLQKVASKDYFIGVLEELKKNFAKQANDGGSE